MNEERCLKRGKRELHLTGFVDFCKKKLSKNVKIIGSVLASVLQKQQKRNISENIFAPQSLNTRSSRSVLITIQRRVVSRGARD